MLNSPTPTVLYEDNHLLVLNKLPGWLTQPNGTEQESVEVFCKQWVKDKYAKPGQVFLEAVHRLDKPVSGVVVFARTSKALSRLNAAMREKKYTKHYLCVVEGVPAQSAGVLEDYLIHDEYQARIVRKEEAQAKLARLHYRVLKQHAGQALLEIDLETGRYHQIRVQLSAKGLPIAGDSKYGSRSGSNEGAIALHHYRLQLPHPTLGTLITIEAPLPATWPFHFLL